jgi:rhodanese-related sulfurtransferase
VTLQAKTYAKGAATVFFLGVTAWVITQRIRASDMTMTPAEVDSLRAVDSTAVFLDVRTPAEFYGSLGHLQDALLIPVNDLQDHLVELEPYKGQTIIVYCRTGRRSGRAASFLNEEGFTAFNMVGGMVQWNAEGRSAIRENGQ